MRRLLTFLLLFSLFLLPAAASISPCYDAFGRVTVVRDSQLALGGGVSGGVEAGRARFELYFLGDYYMEPLGGDGYAASREFSLECGASASWKLFTAWKVNGYLGADLGCFMQFGKVKQDPDAGTVMGHVGIMARVKLMAELDAFKYWKLSLGVYYQQPLMPDYDDYRGIGFLLSLL